MLVKYETCPKLEVGGTRDRVKFCSRTTLLLGLLLCFILVYLPLYYPPVFARKSYDVIVEGWGHNSSRSLPLYIVPDNDTAVIANRSCCAQHLPLLIIVCSSVSNFHERAAIRETWGNYSSRDFRVVFLLGVTENVTVQEMVEAESVAHYDLIQEEFLDSYNNLTLKSVMLLKQIVNYCQKVQFVLKCDDDMFIHVGNLIQLIHHIQNLNMRDVLLGQLICDAKPIQDPTSKWYSPSYMFNGKVYPSYLSGTGYLMDRSAAVKLYLAAMATPLFHLEDVYVTGLCAKKADIKPREHSGFSYETRPLDPCLYIKNKYVITSHRVSPDTMRLLWAELHQNQTCPQGFRSHVTFSKRRSSRC